MKCSGIFFTAIFAFTYCDAYRILGFYPFSGKSHFIMLEQLFKGLARKGHQVDVISTFPLKQPYPNYTDIMVYDNYLGAFTNNFTYSAIYEFSKDVTGSSTRLGNKICESLGNPEFLRFVNNPPKERPYDLIIMPTITFNCFLIIPHLWNIPVVGVSTTSFYPFMHDIIGNPENFAFVPNNAYDIPMDDSLWKRWYNTYLSYSSKLSYLWYTRVQDDLLRKLFGPEVPTVRELERKVSLILVNSYFPVNGVSPTAKALVEVGGLHIQNNGKELSKDLLEWMDSSREGFVYFTFGSMFRIETLPKKTLEIIFGAFEKIKPIRILVKIAQLGEMPIKLPENVKSFTWISQEKVLQHKNIKAFITHGGILGTQESIYYGVPMLCTPIVADQWTNAANYVKRKIAVKVYLDSLTSEDFEHALSEILHNPIYSENVKHMSRIFRDRPQSALETACFWVEFVIRNGRDILRCPSMDLAWWQVALLDVYLVTIVFVLLLLWLAKLLFNSFFIQFGVFRDRSKSKKER